MLDARLAVMQRTQSAQRVYREREKERLWVMVCEHTYSDRTHRLRCPATVEQGSFRSYLYNAKLGALQTCAVARQFVFPFAAGVASHRPFRLYRRPAVPVAILPLGLLLGLLLGWFTSFWSALWRPLDETNGVLRVLLLPVLSPHTRFTR